MFMYVNVRHDITPEPDGIVKLIKIISTQIKRLSLDIDSAMHQIHQETFYKQNAIQSLHVYVC